MELISLPNTPLSPWFYMGIVYGIPIVLTLISWHILTLLLPNFKKNISNNVENAILFVIATAYVGVFVIGYDSFIPDPNYLRCLTETCVEVSKIKEEQEAEAAALRAEQEAVAAFDRAREQQIAQQQEEERERQRLGKFHLADAIKIDLDQWGSVFDDETEIQQDRKESEYTGKYVSMLGKIADIDGGSGGEYIVQIRPPSRQQGFLTLLVTARCTPTNDEEEEMLFTKSVGDDATLVGVFDSYGDITGLQLDYCSVTE